MSARPNVRVAACASQLHNLGLASSPINLWQPRGARPLPLDRAAAPTRPLGRQPKFCAARNSAPTLDPVLSRGLWQCQTRGTRRRAKKSACARESKLWPCRRPSPTSSSRGASARASSAPPPHWKPRQEDVDLGKDYALKRARSARAASSTPVEVTGSPGRSGNLSSGPEPLHGDGRGAAARAPAQVGADRGHSPRRARDLRARRGPAERRRDWPSRQWVAPPEPEETTEWSVDDGGASSPLRAVREERPAGA